MRIFREREEQGLTIPPAPPIPPIPPIPPMPPIPPPGGYTRAITRQSRVPLQGIKNDETYTSRGLLLRSDLLLLLLILIFPFAEISLDIIEFKFLLCQSGPVILLGFALEENDGEVLPVERSLRFGDGGEEGQVEFVYRFVNSSALSFVLHQMLLLDRSYRMIYRSAA